MLTEKEAKKIGINACIEKLGYEFCKKYSETSCSAWGMNNDNTMYCFVGISTDPDEDIEEIKELTLDAKGPFPNIASCLVNMENGEITFLKFIRDNKIIQNSKKL